MNIENKKPVSPILTCQQVEQFMLDYVSGELGLLTRMRFQVHISICSDCKRYLKSYENTIKLGNKLFNNPEADARHEVPDNILSAILNSVSPTK